MWIEHHFTPVCTNSILVCPLLSPMNAILRLKESGELVAMSRDTRCRDLRVIRIVGIKKNNSQNNFSMRCETRKLKKKEIYQSRVFRDDRNVARIKCRLFVSSLRVSDFYPDDSESKHVMRINVGKTNVWQLRRMHFRTTRSVRSRIDPRASND